jgi:hypothetical protein
MITRRWRLSRPRPMTREAGQVPLYFAYGSNMDRAAMARRCPASRVIGLGRLNRHRRAMAARSMLEP